MESEIDPDHKNSHNEGADVSCSILRSKIAELQRKLLHEKDRYYQLQSDSELAQLVSNQEADRYRRDCLSLKGTVARLEEDRSTLREREMRDRDTIKVLLEEMEAKEREFTEKIIELKMENRNLKCGKKSAENEALEYRKKCVELEARMSKLVNEAATELERRERGVKGKDLVEKNKVVENAEVGADEAQVDDEMPERSAELRQEEDSETPESRGKRVVIMVDSGSEGDEDDNITLSQLGNKRLGDEGAKKDLGSTREPSFSSGKVADAQVPSSSANIKGEEISRSPKSKKKFKMSDLSCSSTAKNRGSTGFSGVAGKVGQASCRRKSKNQTNPRGYTGRITSHEQHLCAKIRAETLRSNLNLRNPSFIKSMSRSHVSGSFYLALPSEFCNENLPSCDMKIILEDEKGLEYEVIYLFGRTVLSGGWRGFALNHKLELGDALIFELSKLTRFKVYIIKAIPEPSYNDFNEMITGDHADGTDKWTDANATEDQDIDLSIFQTKPRKQQEEEQA